MAKEVATLLDGTVIGVSCFMRRLQHMGRWIVDEGDDVLIECWPVAIERQKTFAACAVAFSVISVWVHMASLVASAPVSSICSGGRGMATISLGIL